MIKICFFLITLLVVNLSLVQGILAKSKSHDLLVWAVKGKYDSFVLQEIANNFPDAQVRLVELPDEFASKSVAAAGKKVIDEFPDVIIGITHLLLPSMKEFIDPLDGYLTKEDLEKEFFKAGLDAMSLEGKLYGLPFWLQFPLLIYNKDLVPSPPNTWKELEVNAKKLTHDGEMGFLFDAQSLVGAWPFFSAYGVTLENLAEKETVIATHEAIAAANFIQPLIEKGVIQAEDAERSRMDTLFREGKVGMIIDGPWSFKDYTQVGVKWGVAPIPALDKVKKPGAFAFVGGIYLGKYSSEKETAVKFMKYIVKEENLKKLWLGEYWAPSRQDMLGILKEPAIADKYPNFVGIAKIMAEEASFSQPFPNDPEMDYVWGPFNKALRDIVIRGVTPEEALREAEAEFKGLRKK